MGLPASRPLEPGVGGLVTGPALGTALFVLLARTAPTVRLAPRRRGVLLARAAYLTAAAAFEEILWRGVALAALVPITGLVGALALTCAGFAAAHRRSHGRRSIVHLVTGGGFGAAFLCGGLAAAILAHAAYNLLVDLAVQAQRSRVRV